MTSAVQGAPAVVAVMVASDPGEWFERTLESLARVDYENFAVLVIDNAGAEGLAGRIADVLPSAFVKSLDSDRGFSAAANEVIGSVEGAAFFLFLHDDVAVGAASVTELVAEAFRANAGIVGPKLVDWDDPAVLRSVGVRVDPFGFSSPISEPGELDQAQHDTARYVFAVSDAAVLVRADLFTEIGGFDADIPFFGEGVDLCWRAHLAGASVAFAPQAVVAHRERFDERRRVTNRRRLEIRHEARTMLRNYSLRRLLWITPVAFVLSVIELIGSVITGRLGRAMDIAASWFWNLFNLPSLVRSRRQVRRIRRVSDRDYTALMRQGSSRLRGLARGTDGETALQALASSGRGYIREARSRSRRGGVLLFVVAVVIMLYGSRGLINGTIPAIREIPLLGRSGGRMLAEWFSGWREVGLGEPAVAPLGIPLSGVVATVLFGSVGAARRLLFLGPLVVGAVGAWKLLGGRSSTAARAAVLTAYSLNPVILGAVGGGRFAAMITYAIAPWAVRIVARDCGLMPFADDEPRSGAGIRNASGISRRVPDRWRSAAVLALVLTLVTSFTLLGSLLIVVVLVVLGAAATIAIDRGSGLRMLQTVAIGTAGTLLVSSPWLYSAIRHGDLSTFTGLYPTIVTPPSASRIITGAVGPLRSGILGWGLVLAAGFALVVARSWRIVWSVAAWVISLAAWLVAMLLVNGGVFGGSGLELILIPAALGIALAIGMGVLAFEEDVLGLDFGFQQILATLAAVVGVVSLIPTVIASTDGRWFMPAGDFDSALEPLESSGGFRTLWIGDPDVLPVAGWMIGDSDLALGVSTGLNPTLSGRYRGDGGVGSQMLTEAVGVAVDGQTSRLGRILAPMGIRYVVVVDRAGPVPYVRRHVAMPTDVVDALQSQLDMVHVDVNPAMATFKVEDVWPLRGTLADDPESVVGGSMAVDGAIRGQLWESPGMPDTVLGRSFGTRFNGRVPAGSTVFQGVTADPGWRSTAGRGTAERSDYRGWAQTFDLGETGSSGAEQSVELRWSTPFTFRGLQLVQILAIIGLVALVVLRGRERLRVDTDPEPETGSHMLVSIGTDGVVRSDGRRRQDEDDVGDGDRVSGVDQIDDDPVSSAGHVDDDETDDDDQA